MNQAMYFHGECGLVEETRYEPLVVTTSVIMTSIPTAPATSGPRSPTPSFGLNHAVVMNASSSHKKSLVTQHPRKYSVLQSQVILRSPFALPCLRTWRGSFPRVENGGKSAGTARWRTSPRSSTRSPSQPSLRRRSAVPGFPPRIPS